MENSFLEYRDETGVESGSDSEYIDDSVTENVTYSAKKNRTAFVAESEESSDDGSEVMSPEMIKVVKSGLKLSKAQVVSSSEEDVSRRGSLMKTSESHENVVVSSSESSDDNDDDGEDNEDVSPELIPRRRPPLRQKSVDSNESIILRRTKKRMLFLDSDTDNSIVIEHNNQQKQVCRKQTPLKIDTGHKVLDKSMDYDDVNNPDDDSDHIESDHSLSDISDHNDTNKTVDNSYKNSTDSNKNDSGHVKEHAYNNDNGENKQMNISNKSINIPRGDERKSDSVHVNSDEHDDNGDSDAVNSDDDGPDEDLMVMSRATRMSIMGVIPKDNDSDDSDFIQSDSSSRKSDEGTTNVEDLPEVTIHSAEKEGNDDSRITCSPFSSPLQDITNSDRTKQIKSSRKSTQSNKGQVTEFLDLTVEQPKTYLKPKSLSALVDSRNSESKPVDGKVHNNSVSVLQKKPYGEDDEVTIVETNPEIIALSSDDEDDVKKEKSPRLPKSPKAKNERLPPKTLVEYMVPQSYPNQVQYVKKHVRENELQKLNGLQEDLKNVRRILEEMDVESLPDGGLKLISRLSALEEETRKQGHKVANMIIEPDDPTVAEIAKDGYDKGLSWEDIKKASNAVQPRMFGKQAMATHMAERSVILERLADLHAALGSRPAESVRAAAPRLMASTLMPHQLHALAWLQWRETQRPTAGILADDMGLGKTITMIALVASDKDGKIDTQDDDDEGTGKGKMVRGGTLVVCPASLIQQWASEVKKHCKPHAMSVCLHHGAARATQPHRLATYDIVATTYNILQRDNEKNGVLMRIQWRRVILDEAHIVRNHKSATSMGVCALKGRRRWCLTGTPVQNKDLDLFALLKFLRCSPFDDLQMWKKWIDNKSLGGQERLSTVMQCLLLRRTKAQLQARGQLACLPNKNAHLTEVRLTKDEMNVYQKVLVLSKTLFGQFLQQRADKNSAGTSFAAPKKDEYEKMHKRMIALQGVKPVKSHEILVLLLRLRQVCCHCGLIAAMLDPAQPEEPPEGASADLLRELDQLSLEDDRRKSKKHDEVDQPDGPEETATADEAIRAVLSHNNPVYKLDRPSSKISAVMDCLNNKVFVNKGDKAVVVSQWTSVLRLVESELRKRSVRSVTLSGAVPVTARPALIATINDPKSDVKVMLLSLCAGGVGINLCGANHLLLLDPHWNPQLEEQAMDRIYRLGQTKDVNIYRFMCVDTVEQTIRKLQEAKLQLAENVLTGARNNAASSLSIEDLKMLFNMGPVSN